jgi:hypothetical protein
MPFLSNEKSLDAEKDKNRKLQVVKSYTLR